MVALCIILGIIALFAGVLSIRVGIHVEYNEDLLAYAGWGPIKIPLFPRPEKPPKEKKEKTKEETPEEEKPEEKKPKGPNPLAVLYENEKLEGILEILRKLVEVTHKFGNRTVNSFVIDELFFDMTVSKPDAAETAEAYGKMCRKVFPVAGAVVANCDVRKYSINIDPDYLAEGRSELAFSTEISLNPRKMINAVLLFAFGAVFKFGIRLLKGMKPKKDAKGKNSGDSQQPEDSGTQETENPGVPMPVIRKPYGKYEEGTVHEPEIFDETLNTENNTESGV